VALCAALAAGRGFAQADAPKAGSDRDAPRADGVGTGAIKGGVDAKSSDAGGDHGAGQSGPREGDASHASSAVHAGPGAVANQKGTAAAVGVLGMPSGNQGVTLDDEINPVRLDGLAGLQRRANRKTLIANAPKMPARPSANTGINLPFARLGADGGAVRNAIGIVVPGGSQGSGHTVPGFKAHGELDASGAGPGATHTSAIAVGAATGNLSGLDQHRPTIPLNTVTGLATQAAGINGTMMGHIASGPSYIGGPAKNRSGINGTTMQPKR
jgi:hypothetical protein